MAITKQFVSFITDTFFDDVPGEVVQRAKELFLDTLGVTVAGVGTPSAEGVREYVSLEGGGQLATVLGTELRTTPSLAALANGTSAHAWDYDDTAMGMLRPMPAAPWSTRCWPWGSRGDARDGNS